MKNKNRHIGKFFRDQLPEPQVPADDAWAGMNDMLNTAAGVSTVSGKAGKWFSGLTKLKSVILIFSAVLSVSAVVIYKTFHADIESNAHQKPAQNVKSEVPVNAPAETQDGNMSPNLENNYDSTLHEGKKVLSIKSDSTFSGNVKPEKLIVDNESKPSGNATSNAYKAISHEKLVNSNSSKPKNNPEKVTRYSKRTDRATLNNLENDISETNISRNVKRFNKSSNQGNEKSEVDTGSSHVLPHGRTDSKLSAEKQFNIQNLKPRDTRFAGFEPNWKEKIVVETSPKQPEKAQTTSDRSVHIGLDWSLNSSLKSTQYLLTGADSINHIGRHVIPGIFVTKNWKKNGATFTFSPYQSYFGDNKLIRHLPDSANTDSSKSYHNTRFIKSTGLNFSLQYQYHITRFFALNAGASYSLFTAALFRPQFQNWQNKLLDERLKTLKSWEMSQYINPHVFAIKAGLAFTTGRFQLGFHVILPLNNLSKSSDFPLRTLNGQAYLRFLVW